MARGQDTRYHPNRQVGRERYSASGAYFGTGEGIGVSRAEERADMAEMMSQAPGYSSPGAYSKLVDKQGGTAWLREDYPQEV